MTNQQWPENFLIELAKEPMSEETKKYFDVKSLALTFEETLEAIKTMITPSTFDLIISLYKDCKTYENVSKEHNVPEYTLLIELDKAKRLLVRDDVFAYFLVGADNAIALSKLRREYVDLTRAYKRQIVSLYRKIKDISIGEVPELYNSMVNDISIDELDLSYNDHCFLKELGINRIGDITAENDLPENLKKVIDVKLNAYLDRLENA